jgi:hypothetical protein
VALLKGDSKMRLSKSKALWFFVCAIAVLARIPTAVAQYSPGYIWNRQAVWYGGNGNGGTSGNPNLDSEGNPAWEYVALGGGGIGSSDPWYDASAHSILGTYDTGGGYGWLGGDAFCFQNSLIHQWGQDGAPGVIWLNPTNEAVTVNIIGLVQFSWDAGLSASSDYVIATENLQTYAATPLFETTVSPSGATTVPIDITDVSLAANQGLVFTFRGDVSTYLDYYESDSINVVLVPEPTSLSLLGLGGVALLGRRRELCGWKRAIRGNI